MLRCPGKEVIGSMVIGSMGYFTDPYKWGIPWGFSPLILAIDPNFLGHPSKGKGLLAIAVWPES